MHTQQYSKTWRRISNGFGAIGYFSCLLQWLWVAILYLPALFANEAFRMFVLPQQGNTATHTPIIEANGPPLLMSVIGIIITVLILLLAIYILIKLPLGIARGGHVAAQKTAAATIPIITHHKKLPKKKQLQLTVQVVAVLKYSAAVLAAIALVGIYFIAVNLPNSIYVLVGLALAAVTLVGFTLQYAIARWRSVPYTNLL